jgi:autotransporter-associated beta strand protein
MKFLSFVAPTVALVCAIVTYSASSYAAACGVTTSGGTSTVDSDCSSLTWSSGDLDMNSKSVTGDSTAYAVATPTTGTITLGRIYNISRITAPTSGFYQFGIAFNPTAGTAITTVSTLNNVGTISAGIGIYLNENVSITTLNNSGTITGSQYGVRNVGVGSSINSFINSGTISSTGVDSVAVSTNRAITSLQNTGTISGQAKGIGNTSGTIETITNSGTISASSGYAIYIETNARSASVGTVTNTGNLIGSSASIANVGGTLGALNNLQGAGNSNGPVTYTGKLPTNYNIIINSTTQYGQLSGSNVSGVMTFGISSLTMSSSSIIDYTFASVLTGITAEQLGNPGASSIMASSNGYTFTLTLTDVASNTWALKLFDCSLCISSGRAVYLHDIGVNVYPVLAGGTLLLNSGDQSSQAFAVTLNSTITAPNAGIARLSGIFSGSGGLTFNGTGTTVMSGANTYTGGTTVSSGTLSVSGASPTGIGDVFVAPAGTLMGTGTINGQLTVAGILKPGNSPGALAATNTVTLKTGSTYQQDIAGTTQASAATPVGTTGYYSYLNVTGGQFVIQPGATLAPRLANLFTATESGYGSAPYMPVLGDRFRMVTADGGITGKFSTVTQPAELSAGTQFLAFYNMRGSNSLDLGVIPTSYRTTVASLSGNQNAQSVSSALDQMVLVSQAGTSTLAQDQLLYAASDKTAARLPSFTQSLAGEVYAAAVAVIAQTTQRLQQAVLSRLGDTMGISLPAAMTNPAGNTTLMGNSNVALSGGVPTSATSSNPALNPSMEAKSFSNANIWGDIAYQQGNRSSDSYSGGWRSNLYQLVFGSDFYTENGMRIGGGVALSNTTLNPIYGSGTIQQGSLFAYGKMPLDEYVLDAMASVGLNASDLSRSDDTGLSSGYRKKNISGNDVLLSLGLSRPIDMEQIRITPFARLTWQMVMQSGVNEGQTGSALAVNSFNGNGVRGMVGVAVGTKETNPMTEPYTYRAYVGVGAESSGVLNPTLNASLAGFSTNITTPNAGAAFIQAGLYGTAKVADNAYAYAGISGEARTGQTLGTVNLGVRIQF